MTTLTVRFRKVQSGDPVPEEIRCISFWQDQAAAFLRYFCPDLTEGEAQQIASKLSGMQKYAKATYRFAIEQFLPALRGVDQVLFEPWDGSES